MRIVRMRCKRIGGWGVREWKDEVEENVVVEENEWYKVELWGTVGGSLRGQFCRWVYFEGNEWWEWYRSKSRGFWWLKNALKPAWLDYPLKKTNGINWIKFVSDKIGWLNLKRWIFKLHSRDFKSRLKLFRFSFRKLIKDLIKKNKYNC